MAVFPDLSNLSSPDIGDVLSLPNSSYPYYWAWILGGIFFIIALNTYFKEKKDIGKGNILSSMAVSSLACLVLAALGTLVGFITLEIMLYVIAIWVVLTAIWWFSGEN